MSPGAKSSQRRWRVAIWALPSRPHLRLGPFWLGAREQIIREVALGRVAAPWEPHLEATQRPMESEARISTIRR